METAVPSLQLKKPESPCIDLEAFKHSHSWYKSGVCRIAFVPVVDSHKRNNRYFSNDDGKLHWYGHHEFFISGLVEDPECRKIIADNAIVIDGSKLEHDTKYYYGLMEHITNKIWKELEALQFKNFNVKFYES